MCVNTDKHKNSSISNDDGTINVTAPIEYDEDLVDAEEADRGSKMTRGKAKSTILTSPRGVSTNNKSQVKTLLGS